MDPSIVTFQSIILILHFLEDVILFLEHVVHVGGQ